MSNHLRSVAWRLALWLSAYITLICGCTPSVPDYATSSPPDPGPRAAQLVPLAVTSVPTLDGRDGRNLALDQFRPLPMVHVPEHLLTKARFPCIDVHVHPRIRLRHAPDLLDEYVRRMDQQRIALSVSLDGGLGESLVEHLEYLKPHQDRFLVFANLDFRGDGKEDDPATWDCHRTDFPRRQVQALEAARSQGVSGLKLFKEFGLGYRNPDGSLIAVDDPRFDPIWEACGELGLVVILHTADPSAFFQPIDERNERWEELHRHPEWSFHGPGWPSKASLLAARNRVIARHPRTTFIAAHFANDAENLAEVGEWLEAYPNLTIEIAARIAELGRQPYTARAFFLKYADRILFGTDGPRDPRRLHLHWRFLETFDEHFPYAETDFPPQGFWRIYGLGLPDDVLKKIYYENALRILPDAKRKYEAAAARPG